MVNASKITELDIRRFINDRPEGNTLVDSVRFSSDDIDRAITDVIEYFNLTPPQIVNYNTETFPYRVLLILGVSGYLLKGAAVGEASNSLIYSAEGVNISDREGKAEVFTNIGNALFNEFREMSKGIKVSQNVSALLSSHGSEYAYSYLW